MISLKFAMIRRHLPNLLRWYRDVWKRPYDEPVAPGSDTLHFNAWRDDLKAHPIDKFTVIGASCGIGFIHDSFALGFPIVGVFAAFATVYAAVVGLRGD